jgi:hypothetical protein
MGGGHMTPTPYKLRNEICETVTDIQADLETLYEWYENYKIDTDSKDELNTIREHFTDVGDKLENIQSDDYRFLDNHLKYELLGKWSRMTLSVKKSLSKIGHGDMTRLRIDTEKERENLLDVIDGAWTYYSFVLGRIHEVTGTTELSTLLYGYTDDESRIEWLIDQYVDMSKLTPTETPAVQQSRIQDSVRETAAEENHA